MARAEKHWGTGDEKDNWRPIMKHSVGQDWGTDFILNKRKSYWRDLNKRLTLSELDSERISEYSGENSLGRR